MKHIIATSLIAILALTCTARKATTAKPEPKPEPVEEPSMIDLVDEDKQSMARDMLDRVEKIKLVAKLRVDSADFFSNYMISADAGDLLDNSGLPIDLSDVETTMVYRTQNGKQLFWAQPSDGHLVLMTCKMLDNGSSLPPEPMGKEFNEGGGDSNYPYLLQDGFTVYFANNGDNSIGGYDIFMTRRSPDGEVLQPQNIGMPFNSPYNDFMMVIDEDRNLGWWASDREQIPGKLTIYVFEPSQIRENYDADLDNIEDMALLTEGAVSITNDLDARIAGNPTTNVVPAQHQQTGNGDKVLITDEDIARGDFSRLKNQQARDAARGLMAFLDDCEQTQQHLTTLRERYGRGDKSVAGEIKKIEAEQLKWPYEKKRLYNKVMSFENK